MTELNAEAIVAELDKLIRLAERYERTLRFIAAADSASFDARELKEVARERLREEGRL